MENLSALNWFLIFAFALTAFVGASLDASGLEVDRTPGLRQIKPGYYVYLHADSAPGVSSTFNSGIIVTNEGVLVIDALGSEVIASQVRQAISGMTRKPIRFLVSCTHHNPFTGGNAVYADTFKIGHENYRADLLKLLESEGVSGEVQRKKLPDLTYSDHTTLYLGGKEIRILYMGRAHTRGDTIVFVPEDRIAYLSEVFNFDEFPYIADGYSSDWMRTLEKVEALNADVFVPGHGFLPKDPRETRAGLRRHWQILKDVRDAVQKQVDRKASEDEAVRAIDLPQYKKFKGYQKAMEIAVRRIHRELTVGLP
jgi:glyoxylase-like metal-dependent hydrolase (beta-lactamase superfamily II)